MIVKVKYNGEGRYVWRSDRFENWRITVFGDRWIKLDRVNPLIIEEMERSNRLVVKYEEEVNIEYKNKKKRGRKKKKKEE